MDDSTTRVDPSPDRLTMLWRRLKDHRIAQWMIGYVAVAYGIQHAVTLTAEAFDWPHAVTRISMLLLILGVPLAIVFAWYHGERANHRVSGPEFTIISLLLVGVAILFNAYVRPSSEVIASRPAVQEASVTAAQQAAASPKGAISVAVLPFLDLSPAKDQEYFSDGMTEEVTAALAKVPDLRVVARTSAFEFKGKNVEVQNIGQQLHATHIIEGSVRKAGNRLRITAQLIKADDGTHIWAEDYDRELTDVFAIQEDIARAITASLHMTLGLKPGENLVNNRKIDSDSYDKFLRARGIFVSRRTGGNVRAAIPLLEGVVARNPSYAPAWAWLSACYFFVALQDAAAAGKNDSDTWSELREKGEVAAKKAAVLDPDDPAAYTVLGGWAWSRAKLIEAEAFFQKMVSLNPETEYLTVYADRLADAGNIKDALPLIEKAHAEDPLDPPAIRATVDVRWLSGDDAGAIALAKTVPPVLGAPLLARSYASQGRFHEAADALSAIAGAPGSAAAQAVQMLRMAPAKIAPEKLPLLPGNLAFVYLYTGSPERALRGFERQLDTGIIGGGSLHVWHPEYAPVRRTEYFKSLVRKAGYVEYWRAKGWPPQCHPTTGDDFECS